MLRAVLSWEEAKTLMNLQAARYIGPQFPKDHKADFAVLWIVEDEGREGRQAGFYRFDADVEQIEAAIQFCTAKMKE
jgi:hypothetical protein